MTLRRIIEVKARARRAFADANRRHPGVDMLHYMDAIEALPDRRLLNAMAPEFREPILMALDGLDGKTPH